MGSAPSRNVSRRWAMLLTAGIFFASASGLEMMLHLHDGDADHHSCDICYKLTIGSTALLNHASAIVLASPDAGAAVGIRPAHLHSAVRHTPAAPRAPPLA